MTIKHDKKVFTDKNNNLKCLYDGELFVCDSCSDGNCDGVCDEGESCVMMTDKSDLVYSGDKKDKIKNTFDKEEGVQ